MNVELREVTRDNLHDVLALAVAPEQQPYVSPNAKSIAEAHFDPSAWFRVVAAGDELVDSSWSTATRPRGSSTSGGS
jgi:diamine N-acetyltransferase